MYISHVKKDKISSIAWKVCFIVFWLRLLKAIASTINELLVHISMGFLCLFCVYCCCSESEQSKDPVPCLFRPFYSQYITLHFIPTSRLSCVFHFFVLEKKANVPLKKWCVCVCVCVFYSVAFPFKISSYKHLSVRCMCRTCGNLAVRTRYDRNAAFDSVRTL